MSNDQPTQPIQPAAPAPAPAPVKKKGVSRIVTPILALVAALAIGLFGGVLIGHSSASANTRAGFTQRTGGFGQEGGTGAGGQGGAQRGTGQGGAGQGGGAAGGFAGGGFTTGTVVSVSGDTITLKDASGKTVTITTTDSTSVTKTSKSSVSKLSAGEKLTVIGKADSSGNVAATTITEGTTGFGFGGRNRPGAGTGAGN
jgi:hypothetical protein